MAEEDEAKYNKIMPKIGDTVGIVQEKIKA